MNIADEQTYRRHRDNRTTIGEMWLAMLVFGSMGAITWAIRGTSGWGGIDGTIVPGMTWGMLWLASGLASAIAWFANTRVSRPSWPTRSISVCAVGSAIVLLLLVAEWLFFPGDQLGLFDGELGHHLGRTVYTNSQNAIVVGWSIGALLVAVVQRDRYTKFAGLVIGVGFGIGFPLAAVWCLGYGYSPNLVDWWKMWELNSGFFLGLLYVIVLYWAIRQVDEKRKPSRSDDHSIFGQWCETFSMACAAFFVVYLMAREEFLTIGIFLGLFYVVALFLVTRHANGVVGRRRQVSFVYSAFLLIFIMAWGVSSQTGILFGLYDANAVDQYAWPPARIVIFAPAGILVVAAAVWQMRLVLCIPRIVLPRTTDAPRICARMVDLMALTGVVGAASIWPAKIGVLYALFLGLALFATNRINRRFDGVDAVCHLG